jgi:hypothetical protein
MRPGLVIVGIDRVQERLEGGGGEALGREAGRALTPP